MKISAALIMIRDNPEIRNNTFGICANLTKVFNPKNKPNEQLQQQKFLEGVFTMLYGNDYPKFPIEKEYIEFYLNKDKYNSSTEYGKARLELLDKMIAFAHSYEELQNSDLTTPDL